VLMMVYVTVGGMLATTWVQIIKAVLLMSGSVLMSILILGHFGFSLEALFQAAITLHPKADAIMAPGGLVKDPISAISLGLALIFGTAGLPHILMRFFTVSDARQARTSVLVATGFISIFYSLLFVLGFGAIAIVSANPQFRDASGALLGGVNMVALHSITLEMQPAVDRSIRFKSPDYQKNMLQFRERMGELPDYEKMRLFLQFEKLSPGEIADLTGPLPSGNAVPKEGVKKNFIPYLKEKLIWS